MKREELLPLPPARVSYNSEHCVLFIDNGEPSEVGEEMARRIHVMYDRDTDDASASVVEIIIDSAESVLRPLMDAVLKRHGITPDTDAPKQQHNMGYRETVITKIRQEEWKLAPYSEAVYGTESQTLLIENGQACEVSRAMAKDVHVLYGKDYDGGPRLSAVAIRIDRAESVLKPFVDAVLAKYGTETEQEAPDRTSLD